MSAEIRYVEWVDSAGSHRWTDTAELRKFRPSRCKSVGFVIDEADDYVHLVQSLDPPMDANDSDNGDNTICIPKVAITKSVTLRKAG